MIDLEATTLGYHVLNLGRRTPDAQDGSYREEGRTRENTNTRYKIQINVLWKV